MVPRATKFILAALLALSLAARAIAATIVPPRDLADLARRCDAVVLARAGASTSIALGTFFTTRTEMVVLESVSGPLRPGDAFTVEAPGGEVGGELRAVPGSPRFQDGGVYFLPLAIAPSGLYRTALLACGVMREVAAEDGSLLLVPLEEAALTATVPRPDGSAAEPIVPSDEAALLALLRLVLAGDAEWDGATARVDPRIVPREPGGGAVPAACLYFNQDGRNFRWQTFDTGGTVTIKADSRGDYSRAGGGLDLVQAALDVWMEIPRSGVNLVFDGQTDVSIDCAAGSASRTGTIVFNDPCSELADGVLAVGGPGAAGFHAHDGAQWWTIVNLQVLVNDGSGTLKPDDYRRLLTHEVGHGLGFAHRPDSSSIMYAVCCHDPNADDRACLVYTYPAQSAADHRPAPHAGGDRTLLLTGNTARLRGSVEDDGLPAPARLTSTWRFLTGPAPVAFSDPSALVTDATFPRAGTYLLSLAAHDGSLVAVDTVALTVDPNAGGKVQVSFRQRTAGYAGTKDTGIVENDPKADRHGDPAITVDGDEPNDSGLRAQGLLRFEEIFGSAAGQVPPGVPVLAAWLELTTVDAGDGAAFHRMAEDWDERASWSAYAGGGIGPGSEALASPDARASGAPGVVRVDVTASVNAWSRDPCSNHGWALLPLGKNGWDFSSAQGNNPPRLVVEYSTVREEQLIAVGDRWSYFKGASGPPAGWKETKFQPGAGWLTGATGIGYADGDDATVLNDMQNRYAAIYCRRTFTLADPQSVGRLLLTIDYDDGFVAYVNGVEAARAGLGKPGSAVTRTTLATSHEAGTPEQFRLDAALLAEGENVLAVEVHNSSLNSSDLSFIPALAASRLLIADGAAWKLLRGSQPRPDGWAEPDFDDAAWESAPSGFGHGGGGERTELADMQGTYRSVAFRRAFHLGDLAGLRAPRLTVIYQDGAAVFLNGREVWRSNLPAGPVTAQTAALKESGPTVASIDLPLDGLRPGANVIAASVHTAALGSSAFDFQAVLVPAFAGGSPVRCGGATGDFIRGDVQGDGSVDLADAVRLLFVLFAGGDPLACPDAADVDDDGRLRLADAVALLGALFQGGAPPAAPGFECGPDPTADDLPDCSSSGCGG